MGRTLFAALLVVTIACGSSNDLAVPAGEWTLKNLPEADLSVLKRPITLTLNAGDAKANGFAGCNQYFSSFTTHLSSIEFSNIGSTKMYCQEMMDIEDKFFTELGKSNTFRVTGNKLQLLQGDRVLLEFEK